MIVGLVLAAGASQRLGRPKQTLPFGDTTLLGRVVADERDRHTLHAAGLGRLHAGDGILHHHAPRRRDA